MPKGVGMEACDCPSGWVYLVKEEADGWGKQHTAECPNREKLRGIVVW